MLGTELECPLCDRMEWPEGLVSHRRTKVMDEESAPAGLLRAHSTKRGVWAKIHVLGGELGYWIEQPINTCFTLAKGQVGIIVPEVRHCVALSGTVKFFVEFWRAVNGGRVNHLSRNLTG